MWNCPYSNDSFPTYAEDIDGGSSQSVAAMSESAKQNKVTLVAGSIPERSNDKLYNTCCVFDTDGKLLAKHRKVSGFVACESSALHMHAPLQLVQLSTLVSATCSFVYMFPVQGKLTN